MSIGQGQDFPALDLVMFWAHVSVANVCEFNVMNADHKPGIVSTVCISFFKKKNILRNNEEGNDFLSFKNMEIERLQNAKQLAQSLVAVCLIPMTMSWLELRNLYFILTP